MKHLFVKALSVATVAFVAVAGASGARADIVGSVHDLTTATGGAFSTTGVTAEVCVFCHTPHEGSSAAQPLWNRAINVAGYTMYNNAFSSTINMTVAAQPQGVSAACLSCHDGTLAFDQLINGPTLASGAYDVDPTGASRGWAFTGANSLSGRTATDLTQTLTNDHPISVTYDDTVDTGGPGGTSAFNTLASVQGSNVRLFGAGNNQVECGSCHDPHQTATVPFLRVSNAASALCTTCHNK